MRVLYDSKSAARVALGFTHARRNIALLHNCNELVSRSKCNFRISVHHVFRPAGKARNGCADIAASLGMRGFISESNVLSCWPTRHFHVQRLLRVSCCLSGSPRSCTVLLLESQSEHHFASCSCFFSETSCCTQSAFGVFRCPTPSSGFRRSWRTRSNRMLTFRCGGKKRGTQM